MLISNFKVAYNLLRRPDGSFNRHLAEFLDRKVPANAAPVDGIASVDVIIDRFSGVWGRIFWSSSSEPPSTQENVQGRRRRSDLEEGARVKNNKPLLLYFHGGSFVHSSANSAIYDAMCRRLAHLCGCVVLSVNFRRAPEHRYPMAYMDGVACVRWAKSVVGRQYLHQLDCNPDRCFLAGDSSGGNIAHHVALMATQIGLHLSGTVLLMPMFGGEERTPAERLLDGKYFVTMKDRDWYWRAFLPVGADREHPACNPFSASAPSLADVNIPPCLVVVGGFDILQDWQFKFVHSMEKAGKPIRLLFLEQATMGFFLLPNTELFYTLVKVVVKISHKL